MQVRRILGANLLQVTWEHMTLLPAAVLERLRDALLRFLGQSAQCTAPVQEVEELYGTAANELSSESVSSLAPAPCSDDALLHCRHLRFAARDALAWTSLAARQGSCCCLAWLICMRLCS